MWSCLLASIIYLYKFTCFALMWETGRGYHTPSPCNSCRKEWTPIYEHLWSSLSINSKCRKSENWYLCILFFWTAYKSRFTFICSNYTPSWFYFQDMVFLVEAPSPTTPPPAPPTPSKKQIIKTKAKNFNRRITPRPLAVFIHLFMYWNESFILQICLIRNQSCSMLQLEMKRIHLLLRKSPYWFLKE